MAGNLSPIFIDRGNVRILVNFLVGMNSSQTEMVVEKVSDQKAKFDLPRTAPHYNVFKAKLN